MSQFDHLLAELQGMTATQEEMTKALPADDGKDDEKIQAAAEDGGGVDSNEDENAEGGEGGEGAGEGEPMGKSLGTVTLENGEKVDAVDGTELVKSLMEQVGAIKADAAETQGKMAKALESAVGLIKSQGDMIKSLSESVKKLSGEGRGRKAVLSVVDKPAAGETPMAKSEGISPGEFLVKSNAAFTAGKITGHDLRVIDVALRTNASVDPSLVQKVLS